jgi:sorting nexin-1/2
VCSHAQRGSGVSKYTVYTIVGSDRNGAFEAVRRYNEFDQLRKCLLENWPGCFIPALPDKKPLHKNEPQVIENRRRWLNHFMKKIATQEYLYYSEEFQFFLRSTDADVRPAFDKWVRPSIDLLIKKYRQHFGEIEKVQIWVNLEGADQRH